MRRPDHRGPRVVVVDAHLDPLGRSPRVLIADQWYNFGLPAAAAHRAGACMAVVKAAWEDSERSIDGVPCYFVREGDHHVVRLPGGRTVRRRPGRLLERVAACAPDVIHWEGLGMPRELRALAKAFPDVPILAQDHFTKCPRGWRRWWYRWGFTHLGGVAFTARSQAEPFIAAAVLRPSLPIFEVIEVSSTFTPGDRHAARSATGMDGDPCLLVVASLNQRKDPLTLLGAVAQVTTEFPGLRLHMCFRDTTLLDAVRARIAGDPVLAGRVRLIGAVPHREIEKYFQAADFVIQGSHTEATGASVIEALSCGTTPLLTDIPSFRRITGEGEFGALVPIGNAAAFANAIRVWCRRDRATLRRRAREHFERDLSFDAMGRQLYAAYDALWTSR